jgi:hypothetical protein
VTARSPFLRLEQRIAAGDLRDILIRWKYGKKLIAEKAGRKKLRDGRIAELIAEAEHAGIKVSDREIQRRVKCAEVYVDDQQLRRASDAMGSWTALHEAGFPTVDVDEMDDPHVAEIPTESPDEWEQLTLIPGAPEVLRIRGRAVKLADATIGDFKAYCEQSAEITKNFAKRDAQLWAAYHVMRETTGDLEANAVEAYEHGIEDDERDESDKDAS